MFKRVKKKVILCRHSIVDTKIKKKVEKGRE